MLTLSERLSSKDLSDFWRDLGDQLDLNISDLKSIERKASQGGLSETYLVLKKWTEQKKISSAADAVTKLTAAFDQMGNYTAVLVLEEFTVAELPFFPKSGKRTFPTFKSQ